MIRFIFISISILIIYLSYIFFQDIVLNNSYSQKFSYIGTIATGVALLLAIMEILNSIRVTKTIQQKTLKALEDVKKIENASSYSDCLSALDSVTSDLNEEKYESAKINFQNLRKILVKVVPESDALIFSENDISKGYADTFNDIEYKLMKAMKTTLSSPLSTRQKNNLIKSLLVVKSHVESINPAKRS